LYGCETWSLTLREEHRLRLFENRVLRKIFAPKSDEVMGGEWRQLHNAELNDLYSSPSIVWVIKSSRMRWVGHVAHMGQMRRVYSVLVVRCVYSVLVVRCVCSVLVGKPKGKRPLGRPRHRWEDNIKMDSSDSGM